MTTQDITRFLFQPKKHYVGGQLQQGRVLLDSDFNEDAWLTDEDQRRVLKDIVGPAGSPDGGFSLDVEVGREIRSLIAYFNIEVQEPPPVPDPDPVLVYPIKAGSLYLCGLRFELEPRTTKDFCDIETDVEVGDWQIFQRDHLEMTHAEAPKPQSGVTHAQLAYVEGWEQCVSAVEDEEVLEKALGGVDTSVRVRRMARVHVADVQMSDTCASAWSTVQSQLETARGGTFAADGCEFHSGARLQIAFPATAGGTLDACGPCVPGDVGRYLGAENQAIRIMLTPGGYVFGVNNAAPIYRVQVGEAAGGNLPVVMLTPPRDEFRWPLQNTVVEIIGWSALLPNGEKVAAEIGKFFVVTGSFDPQTSTFYLADSAQAEIDAIIQHWDDRHPDNLQLPNDADASLQYLFMRIWHQVDEGTTEPELSRSGPHTLLERLGITPVFPNPALTVGRPGEYWVVSVRPDTPQQIVPWDLTQAGGVPPHGPRHFFAPMTLVHMRPPGPGEHPECEVVDHVEACLEPMRSLTRLTTGCCTVTVGDGITTSGDFSSIQAAIDALSSDGGKVCILPGVYTENVVLTSPNVTLEGCGSHTILRTPGATTDGAAVIHILAADITVKSLAMEARGQVGVLVGEEDPLAPIVATSIVLEDLEITSDRINEIDRRARSPIDIRRSQHVEIRGCDLSMTGFLTDDAVVYLHGDNLLLFDSRISVFDTTPETPLGAWGGVQVAGGCTGVEIRQNTITAGFGHGVTLGSLAWFPSGGGPVEPAPPGGTFVELHNGCLIYNPTPPETMERDGLTFNYETMGEIEGVRIIDNRIEGMLANGISVLTLNRLNAGEDTELITVSDLTIEGNQIVRNIQDFAVLINATALTKATAKAKQGQDEALGQLLLPADLPAAAILLADGENITIRNNVIRDNGASDPEAVCGICVAFGNGVLIEGNRVQNNGAKMPGLRGARPGAAAGIFVFLAGVSTAPVDLSGDVTDLHGSSLRVVGNIVEQPAGLALFARATGPVAIDGNYLESRGNNDASQAANQAYTVLVLNNGLPWEAVDIPAGQPTETNWEIDVDRALLLSDAWGSNEDEEVNPYGLGGRILFTNNHVTLKFVTEENGIPPGVAQGFSVSLGSLDDVIMTGNQLGMNIENPASKKKKSKAGIGTTFQTPPMSAQAIVVGQTVTVSNNRVAEGVVDAQISLLTIGGIAASATGNTTTHVQYVANCNSAPEDGQITSDPFPDQYVIDAHNLVLLPGGPSEFPFGRFWTNAVANTLIQGLCAFFLELNPTMSMEV